MLKHRKLGATALSLCGLLVVLLLLGGCRAAPDPSSTGPTPTFVPAPETPDSPTYTVERGDVARIAEFQGRISPSVREELFFETSGRVSMVYIERDQAVTEGELLAELDIEDLVNQLELADLSLETAQNAFNTAARNHEREQALADINLRSARLQLAAAVAQDTAPDVELARVNLERATAGLAEAQQEYNDAVNRPWEGEGALEGYQSWLDNAQWGYREATALYNKAIQADQAHDDQVALLSLEVQRAELASDWAQIEVDPALTQTVQSAQLTVSGLQARVNRARIVAPIDGTIFAMSVSEGREIRACDPVITLAGAAGKEVIADLDATAVSPLSVGLTGTIELANAPGRTFPVRITQLPKTTGPVEDRDPATHLELLTADAQNLEMDRSVTVRIIIEERRNVLRLPPQAVRLYEGRRFAVVLEPDGRERRVDVTLGVIGTDWYEITEGLEEGQVVIAQ